MHWQHGFLSSKQEQVPNPWLAVAALYLNVQRGQQLFWEHVPVITVPLNSYTKYNCNFQSDSGTSTHVCISKSIRGCLWSITPIHPAMLAYTHEAKSKLGTNLSLHLLHWHNRGLNVFSSSSEDYLVSKDQNSMNCFPPATHRSIPVQSTLKTLTYVQSTLG